MPPRGSATAIKTGNPFGRSIMPGSISIDNGKGNASETTVSNFLRKCVNPPLIGHSSH
jgi:hypothetical protein